MTIPQFKKWLESKRKQLAALEYYEENPIFQNCCSARIATEASQYAAELHLYELMREWDEQADVAEVAEVDRYLVECLGAIPDSRTVLTPPEVAEQLAVAPETVINWIKSSQLKASNLATADRPRYVVQPDGLANFLESRQPDPPKPREKVKAKPSYNRFSE